ncbi:MAG: 2-amino-4-hydroxy-6-hydroxymethyldihydropteridine diphosphokinase [Chloroflexi bacterium]|nr:2-amino-4-hydroxy-6-hydroxymethyldihydropteridine diphosphokinase [Chloroflexota bacterium]
MARVFLGLGSNVGDREALMRQAIERLRALGRILKLSALYETEPVGLADQPWFLNAVCLLETPLPPHDLLMQVKQIERELGRTPTVRYGPRAVDIDLLLYDQEVVASEDLLVPHSNLPERTFVLVPLVEIAPEVIHPRSKKSARQLLEELADAHVVRRCTSPSWEALRNSL